MYNIFYNLRICPFSSSFDFSECFGVRLISVTIVDTLNEGP